MQTKIAALANAVLLLGAAHVASASDDLKPYPLPTAAKNALGKLAGESDVLILGETHGTQEVPAVAAALLEPLTASGYGLLALEIPIDEQQALTDWAAGKTEKVPDFFAKPFADGRGSVQALSLIRTALRPPFRWQLICFDCKNTDEKPDSAPSLDDEYVAANVDRDSVMAANLARQRSLLGPEKKVLAICGGFHARTSNHCRDDSRWRVPPESPVNGIWPSFAAKLQADHRAWRVRSVNEEIHSGAYFALVGSDDGKTIPAGIQKLRETPPFDEAEAHRLDDEYWDCVLNLPRATPATFLSPPINPLEAEPQSEISGSPTASPP